MIIDAYKRLVRLSSMTTFVLSQFVELCSRHTIPIPEDVDENFRKLKHMQEEVAEDIKKHLPTTQEFDD